MYTKFRWKILRVAKQSTMCGPDLPLLSNVSSRLTCCYWAEAFKLLEKGLHFPAKGNFKIIESFGGYFFWKETIEGVEKFLLSLRCLHLNFVDKRIVCWRHWNTTIQCFYYLLFASFNPCNKDTKVGVQFTPRQGKETRGGYGYLIFVQRVFNLTLVSQILLLTALNPVENRTRNPGDAMSTMSHGVADHSISMIFSRFVLGFFFE